MAVTVRSYPRRTAKPKADPRFVAVSQQTAQAAARLKKHAPPKQKAQEASKSAKPPANEQLAGAKAKVVDSVKEAPAPKPQPTSFKALLRAEIEKAMPKTLGETEQFMNPGQAGGLKSSLNGNVAQEKQGATGPVDQANKTAPDPGSVPAKPTTALPGEPAPAAPAVDGAGAMPPPATPQETSLQEAKQDTGKALADEKIKPESLGKANDPRFSAVADAKGKVAAQADQAPAGFQAKEGGILAGAKAQASGVAKRGAMLLMGVRGRGNSQVQTRQQQQAAKEEAERKKVAETIEGIFAKTKRKVEEGLAKLDKEVSDLFDQGVDGALAAMKKFVDDKLLDYKLRRYLTIPGLGLARWLRDQALGLPDEVNAFYAQGRQLFQSRMDALIDRVANLVETRLGQAKSDVAAGQAEIKTYVAGLPANLQATGQAAEKAVGERFTELTQSIDDKKNELASSLAQKYKEAFDKADEALKQMQDENKGLVQQFAEKLGEVIKALMEFKAKLMGLLKKGQEAIQLILDDPIGFLGNLIAAVKGGFNAFVSNIWTHLKAGFMKWLFGSLAAMGIQLPTDLSLPSILKLVLDVLGITYDKMRAKAVKLIGERAVSLIEKAVEYIKEFVTGGAQKLWEKVKEDLASLKEMVIDAIQSWLIETVVKQAVAKVVSMFNPAGAIVQAVIAIYNVVMFVIEKAQQIMALVEAVVNSVYAIATGAIGGAISWIEKSLASAIPVVIGFLARLLGLSGITQKIQEFIKKIQGKVDKAIDKAIAKVVALVKKLFGKGKDEDPEKQKKLEAGEKAIADVVAKYQDGVTDKGKVDADLAAVKRQHPVFKTIGTTVEKGQVMWFYTGSGKKGKVSKKSANWAVGEHQVPPVAKGHQSHHVPQKVLLAYMGGFYQQAGEIFSAIDPRIRGISTSMISLGKRCTAKNADGGMGLSAISLSQTTHSEAHKPASLDSVIKEAQDIKARNDALKTGETGGVVKETSNLAVTPTASTLPSGFLITGRIPEPGKSISQIDTHVQQRHLFNPLQQMMSGKNPGYSADKATRTAETEKAAKAQKNVADAKQLKNKAADTFRAQWNGLLAAGLAGVDNALKKDNDTDPSWRGILSSKAKNTWSSYMKTP